MSDALSATPATRIALRRQGLLPRILGAVLLSFIIAALLIALTGHNPLTAFAAMLGGVFGSPYQIGEALNRTSPYLLAGSGVALCFRAGVINIGADGQIAMGGIGAAGVVLLWPGQPGLLSAVAAIIGAALCGAAWAGIATAIHLGRRVHEVLVTLLLNFVALLLVQLALAGPLGQPGAGFLQSRPLPRADWLWRAPHVFFHGGIILGVIAALALSVLLWKTPFGFAIRVTGQSRRAAAYAGFSAAGITWGVMLTAGGLAGIAGGTEVLGLHHRLIEGFSTGFGFKAVTVALLGALEPAAVIPAALFVGLLESGALSMQRQIGVPSALVVVIEGITMLLILAATVRRA
ncbi:ABC transporter permease [Acidisoma silvae]|uniref:ABC transporter permease n=1 Tax=Acidisoma silvae TaxID=2802396 RepID=A0A963YWV5_9PROT|nr:ABC transporter permease [Acidisoma silvae]MCB8877628.1 ABC transporter permease [Acidisoma silvae]